MKKPIIPGQLFAFCLVFATLTGAFYVASAQCSTLKTVTYDSIAVGSGNSNHIFTVPAFDPSLGTLVSAEVRSIVSLNYAFTLRNVESVSRNFSLSVGRIDHISSLFMGADYDNSMSVPIGTFALSPGASASQTLSPIISRYVNSDVITNNVAALSGNFAIDFSYEPITYTSLLGSVNYYFSASANDTIHFSVTYSYCNAIVLSPATTFSVKREGASTLLFEWQTLNEQSGREYELQQSADGISFEPVHQQMSVANDVNKAMYNFRDVLKVPHGKVYFRLKSVNRDNSVTYSDIKMVVFEEDASYKLSLYPNPSSQYLHVGFPHIGSWHATIISATGASLQSEKYSNASTGMIYFNKQFASGVYFLRLKEENTGDAHVLSFVIK